MSQEVLKIAEKIFIQADTALIFVKQLQNASLQMNPVVWSSEVITSIIQTAVPPNSLEAFFAGENRSSWPW